MSCENFSPNPRFWGKSHHHYHVCVLTSSCECIMVFNNDLYIMFLLLVVEASCIRTVGAQLSPFGILEWYLKLQSLQNIISPIACFVFLQAVSYTHLTLPTTAEV